MMHVEHGSAIIEPRITGNRGRVIYTARICLGIVVGIETEDAEMGVARCDRSDNLMLPVDAALIDIADYFPQARK